MRFGTRHRALLDGLASGRVEFGTLSRGGRGGDRVLRLWVDEQERRTEPRPDEERVPYRTDDRPPG